MFANNRSNDTLREGSLHVTCGDESVSTLATRSELGAPVFAFGAPWFPILEHGLGLRVVDRLGVGGRAYGSAVDSRSVLVLTNTSGSVTVLAEKHTGSAGPPGLEEAILLREELA